MTKQFYTFTAHGTTVRIDADANDIEDYISYHRYLDHPVYTGSFEEATNLRERKEALIHEAHAKTEEAAKRLTKLHLSKEGRESPLYTFITLARAEALAFTGYHVRATADRFEFTPATFPNPAELLKPLTRFEWHHIGEEWCANASLWRFRIRKGEGRRWLATAETGQETRYDVVSYSPQGAFQALRKAILR